MVHKAKYGGICIQQMTVNHVNSSEAVLVVKQYRLCCTTTIDGLERPTVFKGEHLVE